MWRRSQALILLVVVACSGANEYRVFYESLDENLKEPFLKYQLAEGILADFANTNYKTASVPDDLKSPEVLGIEEEIFGIIESLKAPDGFGEHLYELIKEEFSFTRSQMVDLARTRSGGGYLICIARSGNCYDIGDVGSHCC